MLALISYLPDAPLVVEVSKGQASLIFRLSFLVPGLEAQQQRKQVSKGSCVLWGRVCFLVNTAVNKKCISRSIGDTTSVHFLLHLLTTREDGSAAWRPGSPHEP